MTTPTAKRGDPRSLDVTVSELRVENVKLKESARFYEEACIRQARHTEETLGRALGMVLTEEDEPHKIGMVPGDVFTGIYTDTDLVDLAAEKIRELQGQLRWRDSAKELPDPQDEVVVEIGCYRHVCQLVLEHKRLPVPCWIICGTGTGVALSAGPTRWLPLRSK